MPREAFEKLLIVLRADILRDVRKTRYGDGPVTPRMQLTITLKHLGGDSSHDIEKHMGGKCVSVVDAVSKITHTLHCITS